MPDGWNVYRQQQVMHAEPGRLVTLLYHEALKDLDLAEQTVGEADWQPAHDRLIHAQRIIVELSSALNEEAGGPVAASLRTLYDYWQRCLVRANTKKDIEPVRQVRRQMADLAESWDRIAMQ